MRLPWGLRWWELLPEIVLVAGLGLFLVTEKSAATSAFNSTTAIVLMVVTGAGWLAGRVLLVRHTRWPALRLAVFAVAAVGVLTVVVLPAYRDTTVVETLPVAAAPPLDGSTTTPARTPAPRARSPVAVRSAALRGIDHRASGTAVLYRQPDNSLVIGLEDIDIQPGPDYDVYVVPGPDRENIDGGMRLDDLRGNKGTQYYPVPGNVAAVSSAWTVLVWCQTFDVPIAAATPT